MSLSSQSGADGKPDNYSLIAQAIRTQQKVLARYEDLYRELCPHALGINKRRERIALFYQSGGESSRPLGPPGSPENWRCMLVDQLVDVRLRKGEWQTAPNHTRPETCVFRRVEVSIG